MELGALMIGLLICALTGAAAAVFAAIAALVEVLPSAAAAAQESARC